METNCDLSTNFSDNHQSFSVLQEHDHETSVGCFAVVNDAGTSCEDYGKNPQEEQESISIHPLLIEHVIKEILSFFPRSYAKNSDLLVFRYVCKDWRDVITNGMKYKGFAPRLEFNGDTQDLKSFRKFHLEMIQSQNLSFDRFTFYVNFFVQSNFEDWNDFLKVWSPSISELVIKVGKQYSMSLGKLEFEQFDFSNLKRLSFECSHLITNPGTVKIVEESDITRRTSITCQPTQPEKYSQGLVSLFSGILKSASQLEELDLYLPARYFEGESGPEYNSKFAQILIDNLPESVINLKITLKLSDEHLRKLSGKQYLKIKKMDMEYYGSQISVKSLEEWIGSQKGSLKELRLVDFDDKLDNQLNLSACRKISVLTIKGDCFSFSTLKKYPENLEKLIIITPPPKDAQSIPSSQQDSAPAISELDLCYPLCNPKWISDIPVHLTNLKSLKIQIGPESTVAIQSVFQNLGTTLVQLEITFLEILSKTSVDPFITGLPFAACLIVAGTTYNTEIQRGILRELEAGGARKPSIDNLIKLKKLVLKTGNEASGWATLTDVSVHYGFFRCRALEEIEIVGKHSISLECFRSLATRFRITVKDSGYLAPEIASFENNMALVPFVE